MRNHHVLIVYASRHGQTEKIAHRLAARLSELRMHVCAYRCSELPARIRPGDYMAVAVGSPVHFGRHDRCVERFARERLASLDQTPTLFFSVCGAATGESPADREEAEGYLEGFARRTGWHAGRAASVAGAVRYTRYGFLTRWVMKRISAKKGLSTDTSTDHEYTDWDQVDALAGELAEKALAASAP